MMQRFWRFWRNEYLDSIRGSKQPRASTNREKTMTVGDLVTVKDNLPRLLWRTAIVQKLLPGRDGHIRAAIVRTISKRGPIELKRSVEHLYPLEVRCT